ncbi:MAG TPA: ABC transporter permease [Burkholderiales bacterium]|nr:ABC transporter permease [Burkholderiales bacterium]
MRKTAERSYRLVSLTSVGVVLAAWLVASALGVLDPNRLPPAQTLASAVAELVQHGYSGKPFWLQIAASMGRALAGFVIAVLVGVPVGIFIGSSRMFDAVVSPFLAFIRPIPPIAFVPLFVFYFGIGELSKIALIFLTSFLYMTVSAASGVRSVPEDLLLASRSLGLTRRQIFFHVTIPASAASILTGMRVAMTLSWALVVAAELIAAQVGLGFLIMDATTFYRIPYVFVGIITIGLIGLALEWLLLLAERRLLHWRGKQ